MIIIIISDHQFTFSFLAEKNIYIEDDEHLYISTIIQKQTKLLEPILWVFCFHEFPLHL